MKRDERLIFDIGMHTGQDTKHYLKMGYKVLAIEASPILVEEGKKKFSKEIAAGLLTILNVGIADKDATLPFYINKRLTEWSSFNEELGKRGGMGFEVVNVPCVTTHSLFEQYGIPHYLKVDIEGFDFYCINDLPPNGKGPKYVSCEASEVSLLDTMYQKGYRKFKIIHQSNGFKSLDLNTEKGSFYPQYLTIRNGIFLRLDRFVSFKHPYGSAGPFGEDTNGPWLPYETAREQFNAFYQGDKKTALNKVSWFDFHATF